MNELNIHYWSHGPHYQFRDSIVFITWRLAGTLPSHILKLFRQLTSEQDNQEKTRDLQNIKQETPSLFKLYQEYDLELAKWNDPGFSLNEERLARIITCALHYHEGKKYELHAYCVMSNHVHLLIRALKQDNENYYHIADLLQALKRYTANEINKRLGKSGNLWDDYYFDRIIRNEQYYHNVVNYILMNPVAAGLVKHPEDWRDSYYNPEFLRR